MGWSYLSLYFRKCGHVCSSAARGLEQAVRSLVSLLGVTHPVSSWAFWGSGIGSLLCRVDIWARSDEFVGDTINMPEINIPQ